MNLYNKRDPIRIKTPPDLVNRKDEWHFKE